MVSAHDVAAYILAKTGPVSAMKLQKLVYYSQAWHLAWDEIPLFDERVEAWANGPVVYELYSRHRGHYEVSPPWKGGDPAQLDESERLTIDIVLNTYGHLSGRQLSYLTHNEDPWREARSGLAPTERSNNEITKESMQAYYAALDADEEAQAVADIDWDR